MSKARILDAIRKGKPTVSALPEMPDFRAVGEDLSSRYVQQLAAAAGLAREITGPDEVDDVVRELYPDAKNVVSSLETVRSDMVLEEVDDPLTLATVDVAVIHGQLGVAENGAIWVDETDCVHRALPFIAQHLVLLLVRSTIVRDMHEAYRKVNAGATGFGVFIAGPSKTADIEQALVIGAQGARSLTVLIYDR